MDQLDHTASGCFPRPRGNHMIPRDASDRDRDDTQSVALFLKTTGPPSRPAEKPLRRRSLNSRPPKRLVKRSSTRRGSSNLFNKSSHSKENSSSKSGNVVECVSESGTLVHLIMPSSLQRPILTYIPPFLFRRKILSNYSEGVC